MKAATAIFLMAGLGGVAVGATAPAAPATATGPAADLSSPRATLVSVYTAMQAGDVAGVMNCLQFAEPEEREVFEVNLSQVAAPLRLLHAMEGKFGDAGKKPFDLSVEKSIDEVMGRVKTAEISVNGDTAVVGEKKVQLNPNAETELTGVTLKQNGPAGGGAGQWKIVASTFPDSGGEVSPQQLALMKSMRDAVVSACDQTILRLERGEFHSADETFAAYQALLQPTAREAAKNTAAATHSK